MGFSSGFDPGVSVGIVDNFIGEGFKIVLDNFIFVLSSDKSFGGIDGVSGVGDGLSFGGVSDDSVSVGGESDNGGSGSLTLGVF